jgi:hypothetical protein
VIITPYIYEEDDREVSVRVKVRVRVRDKKNMHHTSVYDHHSNSFLSINEI